ncbi:MAG: hypothetical protein EPN84_01720 [Legionella sp.]|nr:MAG: hypothetical protein EPN84_01720 [Legionella sp.]
MPPVITTPPEKDPQELTEHKHIIIELAKSFTKFGLGRGGTVFLYSQTQIMYGKIGGLPNLLATTDLGVFILVANTWRELMTPVGNSIKDAIDGKNIPKLGQLHRVAIYSGIVPFLGTWFCNQAYALAIPLLNRDNSQSWHIPSSTFFATLSLMLLTAEYIYGSNRTPDPAMILFFLSGLVVLGSYYGLQHISTSMFYLLLAQFIQCTSFSLSYLGYLKYKFPTETLFTDLFKKEGRKEAWNEALKINKLGRQPAGILLSELGVSLIVNQLLLLNGEDSLAAYQPLASTIMGLGNAMSQTMLQRVQFYTRQIQNLLKDNPAAVRIALRRLLFHSAWLSIIFPITLGSFALGFSDSFIDYIFDAKAEIMAEAKSNLYLVFILLTFRFLSASPSGMIFAVRNSEDAYHKSLNNYSFILRFLSPILMLCAGALLDRVFHLGSKSYWWGGIIALGSANVINAVFAWKLINYDFATSLKAKIEPILSDVDTVVPLEEAKQPTYPGPQFWQPAKESDIELQVLPSPAADLAQPLMDEEVKPENERIGFFTRSANSIRQARASLATVLGR